MGQRVEAVGGEVPADCPHVRQSGEDVVGRACRTARTPRGSPPRRSAACPPRSDRGRTARSATEHLSAGRRGGLDATEQWSGGAERPSHTRSRTRAPPGLTERRVQPTRGSTADCAIVAAARGAVPRNRPQARLGGDTPTRSSTDPTPADDGKGTRRRSAPRRVSRPRPPPRWLLADASAEHRGLAQLLRRLAR